MKHTLLIGSLVAALALPAFADEATKAEATAAAKKLAESASYAWTTTTALPERPAGEGGGGGGGQGRGGRGMGPTEGKTDKDGYILLTRTFGENKSHTLKKGDKTVITNREGAWQTLEEAEASRGQGRGDGAGGGGGGGQGGRGGRGGFGRGGFGGDVKAPAATAAELIGQVKDLTKDGDAIVGELTEEAAKAQLRFPNVTAPKGTVKFWVKDGVLSKMELKLEGKASFNGNERDMTRTTSTEIKEVGTAKLEIPEEAKKKVESTGKAEEPKSEAPKTEEKKEAPKSA